MSGVYNTLVFYDNMQFLINFEQMLNFAQILPLALCVSTTALKVNSTHFRGITEPISNLQPKTTHLGQFKSKNELQLILLIYRSILQYLFLCMVLFYFKRKPDSWTLHFIYSIHHLEIVAHKPRVKVLIL